MRRTTTIAASAALIVALGACTGDPDDPASPAPTTDTEPTQTDTTEPEDPDTTAPEDPDTTEPADPDFTPPTDLSAEVLLTAEEVDAVDQEADESEDISEWWLPVGCGSVTPDAVSMRMVRYGTGEFEQPIPMHQVAVFQDADAAIAAADDVIAAMDSCTGEPPEGTTRYFLEQVDVGAQGHGLATDYAGMIGEDDYDQALGTYVVLTRRGNVVTLVGTEGGEATIGVARDRATDWAALAWDKLCAYDSAGC